MNKQPWQLLKEIFFSRPLARLSILSASLFATIFGLFGPLLQKQFIDLLTHQDHQQSELLRLMNLDSLAAQPLFLIFAAFICLLVSLGLSLLANYLGAKESILMQAKLAERLYHKTLSLRADSLDGRAVGEIVAVYATDVPGATVFLEQSLPTGANIIFPLILTPLVIAQLFHIPTLPTVALIGLVSLLNFAMAFRQSKFFFNFKKLAADRIGLVNEWIQNIRTLRILGWVTRFERNIFLTREIETQNRVSMVTNGQTMNSVASSITYVLNIVVLATWVLMSSEKVTSGGLLALLWIVGIFLTRSFRQMPWLFTFIFDSWTSLKRVDSFLQLTNQELETRNSEFQKIRELDADSPAIFVKNLNLKIGQQEILKSIDFNIQKGEFVAIVGEVGSGKSLLLLSLMGETGASFSQYYIGQNNAKLLPLHQLRQFFAFVPQEGFIMSSSLRDNIAFEYHLNQASDDKILASLGLAQFSLLQERIEDGLDTEIGERGVNLSGGQKQRISLARVDYNRASLILMDDCLSALDIETEELLISSLLHGAWAQQTRVLVTHRLSVLKQVDRVLFMEHGRIIAVGTFAELLKNNLRFKEFTASIDNHERAQQ